jgi:arabinoxylan arabinofuranohydrolase
LLFGAMVLAAHGEELATTGKPTGQGNPLTPLVYCADPTAIEYKGRLYVYGTNDQQSFEVRGNGTEINYGDIRTLVILSTDDLVNWTYHGTIDMGSVCRGWLYASWAPSIVSRTEDDGETHFYMYFSNGGTVGVVTATSPLGPWNDPLHHALITANTPGVGLCSTPFDPGVCIDNDGVGWLAFGGGSVNANGTALQPGNARLVRLGADMLSLDGDIMTIEAPYQFEANELNVIGGKLVYTFNTSWSERSAWSSYGSSFAAPSACSMCYMTTTDPTGQNDTWHYRGEYFKNPGAFGLGYGNNHTHLQWFEGNYYLLYHTQDLQNQSGHSGGYRSIAINKATVYEWNAKIGTVTGDRTGVTPIRTLNPYQRQEAETMATAGGLHAENFGDTGNTILTGVKEGDWLMLRNVDFGTEATELSCKLSVRGTGAVELRLDAATAPSVGMVSFNTTETDFTTVEGTLDQPINGVHDLYFIFHGSGWDFDCWQLQKESDNALTNIIREDASMCQRLPYYDLYGRRLQEATHGWVLTQDRVEYHP